MARFILLINKNKGRRITKLQECIYFSYLNKQAKHFKPLKKILKNLIFLYLNKFKLLSSTNKIPPLR